MASIIKLKEFVRKIAHLLGEQHEPKDIALGVAIGVFIGFSPLYGFHTMLAILAAVVIHKVNRLAILAGTQVSLPFIAPLIYWAEYKVGKMVVSYGMLVAQTDRELNRIELGLWAIFVGSIVLGLVASCVAYVITLYATSRIKTKKIMELVRAHTPHVHPRSPLLEDPQ